MKILSYIIVALVLVPHSLSAADLPSYDPVAVTMKLRGSADDRTEAVNTVLANTEKADAATLFIASLNANGLGLLEDAGFLFYAAQMRAAFDTQRFEGGDIAGGPAAAFGALRHQIGEIINPAIVRDPNAYSAIVERLEQWDLTTTEDYKPGWESGGKRVSEAEETAMIKKIKEGPLKGMRPLAKLLQYPEYFSAFRTSQDFNFAPYKEQRDPERIKKKKAAEETILRIEKEKGLSVMSEFILKRRQK